MKRIWLAAAVLIGPGTPAMAADRPRIALVAGVEAFGSGPMAAVLINVGERWALEPRVRFRQDTTEGPGESLGGPDFTITSTRRRTETEWGLGTAVLRFFRSGAATSSYAGASVRLTRVERSTETRFHGAPEPLPDAGGNTSRSRVSLAAVLGAQHALASRFASSGRSGWVGATAMPFSWPGNRTTTPGGAC